MSELKEEEKNKRRRLFDKKSNYVKDAAFVLIFVAFCYWWFFEFMGLSVSELLGYKIFDIIIFFFIGLPLWALYNAFGKKS